MALNRVKKIQEFGQSIWYDNLERRLIREGAFQKMIAQDGLRGVTSNPTIFDKAISKSKDYDGDIYRLADQGLSTEEIYWSLVIRDIQDVADIFEKVYRETGGLDGYVSLEVNPLLARETEKSIEQALDLWRKVARKNLMVKIPATREGIPAIRELIRRGLNINVTLIFSTRRYREVMQAYLEGLEERSRRGEPIDPISSVASFFVSRVDTLADKALEERIKAEKDPARVEMTKGLLGKTAIANSKLAYREFERFFASRAFAALKAKGGRVQRPLWASTSTKNPQYSDVLYVEALIGPHTVDTLPPATLDAFRDHGRAEERLTKDVDDALRIFDRLGRAGIDMGLITDQLEDQGVELFAKSFTDLLTHLGEKTARLRASGS